MTSARSTDDQALLARCRDRGFTPGARDVEGLIALWEQACRGELEDDAAQAIIKALARGDHGVARALQRGWAEANAPERVMRLQVLGRIAGRIPLPELPALLEPALGDSEPRVIREAARIVGKLADEPDGVDATTYEPALLAIAEQAALPERRAAVEALGRIGSPDVRERLQALASDDPDLNRRTAEAITLLTRRARRADGGRVVLDRPLPSPTQVWLRARGGARATVEAQARALLPAASLRDAKPSHETAVPLQWAGPLGALYQIRSATEIALSFPLPAAPTVVERVTLGLAQPALIEALAAWTDGPLRFRLALGGSGRRRAEVWKVARRLTELGSPLINDSRAVCWTIEVDEARDRLWCLPRGADPRFTYRIRDVPAATHPTFAALLAWAGAPRAGEVVWDPFCGSGTELVEAAKLADDLELWGTDISEAAIEAARENLAAAGLASDRLHLQRADALSVNPGTGDRPVSLILANAPMGRRVAVEDRGMRRLLDDFVTHAARVLAPGGRMVWLTPAPRATAHAGRAEGLVVEDLDRLDMGGFFATPQVLRKPG